LGGRSILGNAVVDVELNARDVSLVVGIKDYSRFTQVLGVARPRKRNDVDDAGMRSLGDQGSQSRGEGMALAQYIDADAQLFGVQYQTERVVLHAAALVDE
jgi:hypothetical protein